MSDLYEFMISLFEHGDLVELLSFVRNYKMILVATRTPETDMKVQCLCTLVRGKALSHFDLLSVDVENTDTSLTVDYLLKVLAWYFSL